MHCLSDLAFLLQRATQPQMVLFSLYGESDIEGLEFSILT
jgi:hypothetical protein